MPSVCSLCPCRPCTRSFSFGFLPTLLLALIDLTCTLLANLHPVLLWAGGGAGGCAERLQHHLQHRGRRGAAVSLPARRVAEAQGRRQGMTHHDQ